MERSLKSKGIRIHDGKEILDVTPKEILTLIPDGKNLNWAILFLEATGDLGEKKWAELDSAHTLEKGYWIAWKDLVSTCNKFWQVIDITIIGCKDKENLKQYKKDIDMYESCDIVIEIIDGGYCEVFSKDHDLINRLAKSYNDIELLDPDWNLKK